ncbi:AMIN-like domain-containing (lipo)protein [Blastococcus haudaquaticus]|uniref:AMIN-like domain-containing protein n=1 Tax=Blastococcus haudaquaticus TaxID=1938745 RepID=A0A286GZZ5_9ACTN|nr:hypothetical protein [Blastococcus haudaquaticus]SOE01110.1 hypothetical protein SAMN06272739_2972 [Blastococcus haudaquaticus]
MTRKPARLLALAVTTVTAAVVGAVPAQAAEPYCGITWGSLAKAADDSDAEVVTRVRAGRHACFDRLVIDLGGHDATFGSYAVEYVPLVRQDGSGADVPVRGAADLQVVVKAPAYRDGTPTFEPVDRQEVVDVSGYSTFRQVAWANTYEGRTTLALGVRARLPFRVFSLAGTASTGPRLVIDVAHAW